jgi:hypothetical protein
MLGKAIDFYIPGVSLEQLREAGLRAQRGGVGFYPTSGAPFVHMDTGSVRHWPRMPEAQLASVLSKGQLGSASGSDGSQRSRMPGLLAKLFGVGRDEAQDAATAAASPPVKAAANARKPAVPESRPEKPATVVAESRVEKVAIVPFPPAKPAKAADQFASAAVKPVGKPTQTSEVASAASEPAPVPAGYEVASAMSKPESAPRTASVLARANVSANDVINERGYWQGLPSLDAADASPQVGAARTAPSATPRRAIASAVAAPWPLTDRSDNEPMNALAYAAQPTPIAAARALPAEPGTSRVALAALPETTIAVKRSDDYPSVAPSKGPSVVRVGDRFNDPWMRAMIVSPSAQIFMKTTVYGVPDFRALGPYLVKPASTMMATFSEDPYRGMTSESFAGSAVGFTRTVTFSPPRTAALQ